MTDKLFDPEKARAFTRHAVSIIDHGSAALCLNLGHRLGLFDLMATMPPASSEAIAEAAGLSERYVREWLHALVLADVIEYQRDEHLYHLPPEHAASISRSAGPRNIAFLTQHLVEIAGVRDEVFDAFRSGAGVPYSSYPGFHTVMAEGSARRFDHNLISAQGPLVEGIVPRLEAGIDVADLGCGSGHALNLMVRRGPTVASPATTSPKRDWPPDALSRARWASRTPSSRRRTCPISPSETSSIS